MPEGKKGENADKKKEKNVGKKENIAGKMLIISIFPKMFSFLLKPFIGLGAHLTFRQKILSSTYQSPNCCLGQRFNTSPHKKVQTYPN